MRPRDWLLTWLFLTVAGGALLVGALRNRQWDTYHLQEATPIPRYLTGPLSEGWIARRATRQELVDVRDSGAAESMAAARKYQEKHLLTGGGDILALAEKQMQSNRREFDDFLANMQPGDELWFFSAPPQWPTNRGYSIVRDGHEVERYTTAYF